MSKRFTDTDKWKDEWYLSLPNDSRIVWQYICDNCTNAGRLKKNFKLLNFCCNTNLTDKTFKDIFNGRVVDQDGFYFLPKFLKFQYPKGLNSNKPSVVSIRNELVQYGLTKIVNESLGNDYLTVMDTDTDTDTDKDMETEKDKGLLGEKEIGVVSEKKKIESKEGFKKPTLEEVISYCKEINSPIDPAYFFEKNEGIGWVDKHGNKYKNWKAVLRQWILWERKNGTSRTDTRKFAN